jgi:hypothetical protein
MPRSRSEVRDEDLEENAEPFNWGLVRLSDDEITEFAQGMLKNQIFTEVNVHPRHRNATTFNMVFMGMTLAMSEMTPETRGALKKSPPGMLYAHYRVRGRDNTFPRTVNGYPIFNECGFLSKEDTNRVQDKYEEILKENPWLIED